MAKRNGIISTAEIARRHYAAKDQRIADLEQELDALRTAGTELIQKCETQRKHIAKLESGKWEVTCHITHLEQKRDDLRSALRAIREVSKRNKGASWGVVYDCASRALQGVKKEILSGSMSDDKSLLCPLRSQQGGFSE